MDKNILRFMIICFAIIIALLVALCAGAESPSPIASIVIIGSITFVGLYSKIIRVR